MSAPGLDRRSRAAVIATSALLLTAAQCAEALARLAAFRPLLALSSILEIPDRVRLQVRLWGPPP